MVRTLALACLVPLALVGCEDDPRCDYTAPAAASGASLHVASCGRDGGSGAADDPLATFAAALDRAGEGATIAIGPGSFAWPADATALGGVSVVGSGSDQTFFAAGGARGLRLSGGGTSTLRGFSLSGASDALIRSEGASLVLIDLVLTGGVADPEGSLGHGVAIRDAQSLVVESCLIEDNGGVGVWAHNVGSVEIIDPTYAVSPRAEGAGGIIDPTYKPATRIAHNAEGGVAIIDPTYYVGAEPAGIIDPTYTVAITGVDIAANGRFAVALFGLSGGAVQIEGSALRETSAGPGALAADGLHLTGRSDGTAPVTPGTVSLGESCVVRDNEGAGVVIAGSAAADISASVAANAFGGVWSQGAAAVVELSAAAWVGGNTYANAFSVDGASLDVAGATLASAESATWLDEQGGSFTVADGLAVLEGARATLSGATVADNPRAGVLAMGAASLALVDTTISGAEFGVALNLGDGGAGADELTLEQTCEGVSSCEAQTELGVVDAVPDAPGE